MYLGMKAVSLGHSWQIKLSLMCFMLALRYVLGTVYARCSWAEVAASKPCKAGGVNPTKAQCRMMSNECCIKINSNGSTTCYARRKNPNSGNNGNCLRVHIVNNKQPLHQFLESDVMTEMMAISELQCWDHCLRHAHCKAYNYQYRNPDEEFNNCWLLSSDVGIPVPRDGFLFRVIELTNDKKALLGNMCH